MRLINPICRAIIGGLFIFSGLIKLNDPFRTAYKLEEYFEVFSQDFSPFFLHFKSYSLLLPILISGFEVVLGVAILFYYRMKITMWITLLLILFFTFLTFYSFFYNKVPECGCFGTAIKLTAKQSFIKDLILLGLILVLFKQKNRLAAGFNNRKGDIFMAAAAILAFGIGIYSKNHLPFIDTSAYKKGNDLKILTKPKETARYEWILEKNGKEFTFDNEHYPSDTTYKYKGRILLTDSSLLVPEISSFRIYDDEGDFTDEAFRGSKIFIIIVNPEEALENCDEDCINDIKNLAKELEKKGVKPMILTVPQSGSSFDDYRNHVQLSGDYYFMDDTVLKTMVRSNPGLILIKEGVIIGKWHHNDIPEIQKINSLINK